MKQKSKKHTITSNEVKLYKHMDRLQIIQDGAPAPTLLHIAPTNRCNQNCTHCCFSERDKNLELDTTKIVRSIDSFKRLGIKSVEWTGGGDPTKHTFIQSLINYVHEQGLPQGMNTNALEIGHIEPEIWKKLTWLRVALNVYDNPNKDLIRQFEANVQKLIFMGIKITACYIVQDIHYNNLDRVFDFSKDYKIYTRVAPDCINTRHDIKTLTNGIVNQIKDMQYDSLGAPEFNKYIIPSDFNVYLFENEVCMMHMLKPFLYTDGYVYCCPSSELAMENMRTMQPQYRVCRYDNIDEAYKDFKVFDHKCSYCKYAMQNNILNNLTIPVEDEDFV